MVRKKIQPGDRVCRYGENYLLSNIYLTDLSCLAILDSGFLWSHLPEDNQGMGEAKFIFLDTVK